MILYPALDSIVTLNKIAQMDSPLQGSMVFSSSLVNEFNKAATNANLPKHERVLKSFKTI